MEEISDLIADYVQEVEYEKLPREVVHEVERRVVDALANAAYSSRATAAGTLRAVGSYLTGDYRTVDGDAFSPDYAAFYNTFLIRYLDFNDTYLSREPLHPSDMLGGLLAVGAAMGSTGRRLVEAAAVGYEIGVRLCDYSSLRARGFDHVLFLGVAEAAAISKLMGLDRVRTKNAISLSLVPNVALRETRSGALSMWKAGAAADASRNATFAAILAKEGVTGPALPFSGRMGLVNVVLKDVDEKAFKDLGEPRGILRTHIKEYPAEYHAQAAIEAALSMDLEGEVEEVIVETYEAAKTILADDPSKWAPENRETADHSLPFMVSVALVKRRFWLDSYDLIGDPTVRRVMSKVKVVEKEEFTLMYPKKLPVRIRVKTERGTYESYLELPRGHADRPMSDAELIEKARDLGLHDDSINAALSARSLGVRDLVV
ncbi:MmgE/PrpD family protein [Conexivisphaera calida]|uniref:2-methylcitrate dehydratase n=1 Tax=Conexivisphaera calida TaxID=1874277 RepID=A0A4P2VCK4_9ARCH|nr:MmgE/PrpD family protein [Conexivisphaera calida]BBE41512.1 2-methylcitrate dehydratase [Conexivisphaera calida]